MLLLAALAALRVCLVCLRRPSFKDLLPKLEWYLQLTRDFTLEQLELPLRSDAPLQ